MMNWTNEDVVAMVKACEDYEKARIAQAVEVLDLKDKKIFTVVELETIAALAKCPVMSVMRYLRHR